MTTFPEMVVEKVQLKPCPFCNSVDGLLVHRIGAADEWWSLIYCDNCCTHGPTAATQHEAIDAWNTRAALEVANVMEIELVEQIISAWAFAHDVDGAARNDLMRRFSEALAKIGGGR